MLDLLVDDPQLDGLLGQTHSGRVFSDRKTFLLELQGSAEQEPKPELAVDLEEERHLVDVDHIASCFFDVVHDRSAGVFHRSRQIVRLQGFRQSEPLGSFEGRHPMSQRRFHIVLFVAVGLPDDADELGGPIHSKQV